jgi:hypothetical protein
VIDLTEYTLARRQYLRRTGAYCVYIVCPDQLKPCRVDITIDPSEAHRLLQRACWFHLHVPFLLWTPVRIFAQRIASMCQAEFEISRLDGDWFDAMADDIAIAIDTKAKLLFPTVSCVNHNTMMRLLKSQVPERPKISAI